MSQDVDNDTINALLYERAGYEARLKNSEDEENEEQAAVWKQSIADVNKALKHYGHEAKAPAKRAETRPAKGAETR